MVHRGRRLEGLLNYEVSELHIAVQKVDCIDRVSRLFLVCVQHMWRELRK